MYSCALQSAVSRLAYAALLPKDGAGLFGRNSMSARVLPVADPADSLLSCVAVFSALSCRPLLQLSDALRLRAPSERVLHAWSAADQAE